LFGVSLPLAAATGISPVVLLIVSRALAGFFNANIATAQAYMADVTPEGGRTAAMGLVGAAFGLGFVLGPALSGALWIYTDSPTLPFFVAAASEFGCFLWALRVLPETNLVKDKSPEVTAEKRRFALADMPQTPLRVTMLAYLASTLAMAAMENTLGLFVMDSAELHYTPLQFAMLLLYLGVMVALTQGLAGTPWATTTPAIYALMGALCFGYGLVSPSLSSLASKLAPEAVRGEVLGFGQSMASLGRIVGPILGGWLYQSVSHGATYGAGAAFSAACALLAVVLDRTT
jgi:DHA1 family tetracycline resistance protein-like MFS transporter